MMLKRIVMQVSGRVMVLFTTACIQLTTCLSNSAKRLLARITQIYLSALIRLHQLVQMVLSINHLRVSLTTAVQSIKRVLSIVKSKAIQIGLRLQIIARQILQRAKVFLKKGK
jgi:hypothetical protein